MVWWRKPFPRFPKARVGSLAGRGRKTVGTRSSRRAPSASEATTPSYAFDLPSGAGDCTRGRGVACCREPKVVDGVEMDSQCEAGPGVEHDRDLATVDGYGNDRREVRSALDRH